MKTGKSDWKAELQSRSSARGNHCRSWRRNGLVSQVAEAGGADLIIIYNSGRFRMAGRGSLAG